MKFSLVYSKFPDTSRSFKHTFPPARKKSDLPTPGIVEGFGNDPPGVFEPQIKFLRKAALPLLMVSLLNALPNTQLWLRIFNSFY